MTQEEKRLAHYMKQEYTMSLRPLDSEDGRGWIAEIQELRGCMSDGPTPEEAIANLMEAKEVWLTTAIEEGMFIPEPMQVQKHGQFSGRLTLRIPGSLHARLALGAEAEGVSLNQWIVHLLSQNSAVVLPSHPHTPDSPMRYVCREGTDAAAKYLLAVASTWREAWAKTEDVLIVEESIPSRRND